MIVFSRYTVTVIKLCNINVFSHKLISVPYVNSILKSSRFRYYHMEKQVKSEIEPYRYYCS